jgi:hypothetical protein
VSYCDAGAELLECASDAVPGLPAYTFPAWPVGLNGEQGALAAPPGVIGFAEPHLFAGASG